VGPGILIVDDHVGFRSVARALLEAEGFHVVGEAGDAAEALTAAGELRPWIVLLDIYLPDGDGFAVSLQMAALPLPPKVVLTSSRPIADLRQRVANSPVAGFIPKDALSGAALRSLVG
jgi:DNA-binding NarL/FixJ family response regulator